MMEILKAIWGVMNSPAGITVAAAVILWVLNRVYASKPAWQAYEGTIIAAVKFAEKNIPDDSGNTALARLDAALKYVLTAYTEATGKVATPEVTRELKEGIQVKHAELEAAEILH